MNMDTVGIFIPHHKDPSHLPPLFESLEALEDKPKVTEIVLINNDCTDGSIEWVEKNYPYVQIFNLPKNQGFAPALNQAVKEWKVKWVCFLNNDVRVDPGWLSALLQTSRSSNAICFSSHIMDWQGKSTQCAGGWINLFGKGFEDTTVKQTHPFEIFFPCGCGMMIHRDTFLEIGGFDDDFFMIYEDVDLGWRLRLMNEDVYCVPSAVLFHKGHASLKKEAFAQKAVYFERNSLATLFKNLEETNLHSILPWASQEIMLRSLAISGFDLPLAYNSDGQHIRDAITVFFHKISKWRAKRNKIQSQRIISDENIFQQFFPHPNQIWAYSKEHYNRINYPIYKKQIEKAFMNATESIPIPKS